MALILRIDVDKPYGRASVFQKVISKIREDYFFPAISSMGYLHAAHSFAFLLSERRIPGVFYFRNCTAPSPTLAKRFVDLNHGIGFHAEDTRSFESFRDELAHFQKWIGPVPIHSFTKHGSGELKLGRTHYPPYEEQKYLEWSAKVGVPFLFGNGAYRTSDFVSNEKFYPKMFWIEEGYRNPLETPIEWALAKARSADLPILVHPENFYSRPWARTEMNRLMDGAEAEGIAWKGFR